jgi:hypothetical protein
MTYLNDFKLEYKIKMLIDYYLTTESAEYVAKQYNMSLATFRRAIRGIDVKVKANDEPNEIWKQDITGYYVSNFGRVKTVNDELVKVFKNLGGLNAILHLPNGKRRFQVKDLMFRTFIRPIFDGERVVVNGDVNEFGLNDLIIVDKG